MINCKKCNRELFQFKDKKIKIRTNIIIFEKFLDTDGVTDAIIKCSFCKEDNKVPIILDTENVKLKHLIFEKK